MKQLAILCIILLGGCFIVPKTATTEKIVSRGSTAPRPTSFDLDAQGFDINVVTSARQSCARSRYVDVVVTRGKEAEFLGPDAKNLGNVGPYGVVFLLMGSMASLPISGIVTAIVVGTSKETTVHERRYVGNDPIACEYAADVPVTFTWPSGTTVKLTTDLRGAVIGHVPAAEVDSGVVTVRVADLPPRSIRYSAAAGRDPRWAHRLAEAR